MLVANLECLTKSNVFSRLGSAPVFDGIYPWAYKSEGIARLWLGDQIVVPSEWIVRAITGATFLIIICNVISLAYCGMRSLSVFFLALVMLMFVPLGPMIVGNGSEFFISVLQAVAYGVAVARVLAGDGHKLVQQVSSLPRNCALALGFVLASVNACLVLSVT